ILLSIRIFNTIFKCFQATGFLAFYYIFTIVIFRFHYFLNCKPPVIKQGQYFFTLFPSVSKCFCNNSCSCVNGCASIASSSKNAFSLLTFSIITSEFTLFLFFFNLFSIMYLPILNKYVLNVLLKSVIFPVVKFS